MRDNKYVVGSSRLRIDDPFLDTRVNLPNIIVSDCYAKGIAQMNGEERRKEVYQEAIANANAWNGPVCGVNPFT